MSTSHCKAVKADGSPCKARRVSGSDYCYYHDPKLAAKRNQSRSAGGLARHGRKIGTIAPEFDSDIKIDSLDDVKLLLAREIAHVLTLEKSLSRARTMGYLLNIAAGIIKDSQMLELENRINDLENMLKAVINDNSHQNGKAASIGRVYPS